MKTVYVAIKLSNKKFAMAQKAAPAWGEKNAVGYVAALAAAKLRLQRKKVVGVPMSVLGSMRS